MLGSLRRRLLFHSLLISLVTIAGLSLVAMLLIRAHFLNIERNNMALAASRLRRPLQIALNAGAPPSVLPGITQPQAIQNRMRIRVYDAAGILLHDTGPVNELPGSERPSPFQFPSTPDDRPPAPISAMVITEALYNGEGTLIGTVVVSEGPAPGHALIEGVSNALLMSGLLALALATILSLISAYQLTQPLLALGSAADSMAAGNLETRADLSGMAEFDNLGERLNRMAGRLAQIIDTLESEREVLRRLISDAGHELRTPLTALKTFLELLQQEPVAQQKPVNTFVTQSVAQVNQLDRLTRDLLSLSRFEARLSGTNFEYIDVRPALQAAAAAVRPKAQKKQQTLDVTVPPTPMPVRHDPTALQQAVGNLVQNAVKYSPAGSTIRISLRSEGSEAVIEVADDGPGIPEADQPHIFNRFFRGRHQKDTAGSGLGLAISREIVALHGGRITLASRPGAGSVFTMRLPTGAGPALV